MNKYCPMEDGGPLRHEDGSNCKKKQKTETEVVVSFFVPLPIEAVFHLPSFLMQ
jgi:hypothetical protein